MTGILNDLTDLHGPLLRMDGFDDCVCGVVYRFGCSPVLCYDHEKVLAKLMQQGMSREDAEEFHEFNQLGAYHGELTPAFLRDRR